MSKVTYIRFGAKNNKGVRVSPQTITLATIVGEPLNFGGVIRLTDPRQIEKLLGEDSKYHTEFEDGSRLPWFTDVTAEYAARERKPAKAEVVEPEAPEESEEPEEETEPGAEAPAEEAPAEDSAAAAPAAAAQRSRRK